MKLYKIVLGILFLASVWYAYRDIPQYLYEGTAISNALAGIILMTDGTLSLRKRRVPDAIYLPETCFIMTVYIITTFSTALRVFEGFSFKGGFMLLHAVNPLVFLTLYLFASGKDEAGKRSFISKAFLAPLLITAYLMFDFIRWLITGTFVYGLIPSGTEVYFVLLFGAAAVAMEAALGLALAKLKEHIASKMK